ncbi:hypothetical protein DC498_25250 [Terrimonas sp.]|uniref:hypothetical protein n=1 Tax=Terrimonas sp. TaxID=1914338 RepID=UPI000D50A0FE|nr:hypothetical protein [Terrimonas sp.]PVD49392.1 hypothetical protein DC498_25250 [Terrimonas sp.]
MRHIIFIALVFLSCASFGQNRVDDYRKMIDSAIIMQTISMENFEDKGGIYLIDQNDQPYIFLSNKDQSKFKPISVYAKNNRKLLKNGVNAWKVIPALANNKLVIHIVDFTITYKKRNYNFANGGGAKVVFEYSCKNDRWELTESKWSGI